MKICIDAGHGGIKSGATFEGLEEKDVNLVVALSVKNHLESYNIPVVMTRDRDVDVSLQQRCDIANGKKCDIFISLHCNADPDDDSPGQPEAKGEEIWFRNGSEKAYELAEIMGAWVDEIFPDEPFRGLKGTDDLYVLNHTAMPAILIEMGFIDNSTTVKKLSDPDVLEEIGITIFNGIVEYINKNGGEKP